MYFIRKNPLVGILLLIVVIVGILVFNDIKLNDIENMKFNKIYNENPISIIIIALILGYGIYELLNIHNDEDDEDDEDYESLSKSFEIFHKNDAKDMIFMLRTKINGKIYYLCLNEETEDNLYNFYYGSREKPPIMTGPFKSTICHNGENDHVQPVLLSEELLMVHYDRFMKIPRQEINYNSAENIEIVDNDRYIHHWNIYQNPNDEKKYELSGYIISNLIGDDHPIKYSVSARNSFSENYALTNGMDGRNFACLTQDRRFENFTKFNAETKAVFKEDKLDIDNNTKKIIGSNEYKHLNAKVSFSYIHNGKKYHLAWLDDYRDPRNMNNSNHESHYPINLIPVGFVPENYDITERKDVHNTFRNSNIGHEFNNAHKLEFDIIALKL